MDLLAWFVGWDEPPEDLHLPRKEYDTRQKALDSERNDLSPDEYNHIAAMNVRMNTEEQKHIEHIRNHYAKEDGPFADGSSSGNGALGWLSTVLAPCPVLPVQQPSQDAEQTSPICVEPDLVMLDGTSAAALASVKSVLSPEEYDHILSVQCRLAELEIEEQKSQALRLAPKKLPQYLSEQPQSRINPSTTSPLVPTAVSTNDTQGSPLLPEDSALSDLPVCIKDDEVESSNQTETTDTTAKEIVDDTSYLSVFSFKRNK